MMWTENHKKILSELIDKCCAMTWLHNMSKKSFGRIRIVMSLISKILVSLTSIGILTNSQGDDMDCHVTGRRWVTIVASIILFISVFIESLIQAMEFETRVEQNRLAALEYLALYNELNKVLQLEEGNPSEQISEYNKQYNTLVINNNSYINIIAKWRFGREFNETPSFEMVGHVSSPSVLNNNNNIEIRVRKGSSLMDVGKEDTFESPYSVDIETRRKNLEKQQKYHIERYMKNIHQF